MYETMRVSVIFRLLRCIHPFPRLYFTRVKLGNPPKEFYVQIDTGSDILWVSCAPCSGCPNTSALNVKFFSLILEILENHSSFK